MEFDSLSCIDGRSSSNNAEVDLDKTADWVASAANEDVEL